MGPITHADMVVNAFANVVMMPSVPRRSAVLGVTRTI
jgi:hypothetical protein